MRLQGKSAIVTGAASGIGERRMPSPGSRSW
jgi:NADP-dependent 3-hydroxy acid dehydrogenase YdfG